MATHGDRIKEARLKQGKSIQDLAQQTRISAQFLEAIETNQIDAIPGDFFRRSFMKQYATALGLNPDEFQPERPMEFQSLPGGAADPPLVRLRELPDLPPLPAMGRKSSVPWRQVLLSVGLLVGVLAICAVAYTLWEDFQVSRGREESATIPETPFPSLSTQPEPVPEAKVEEEALGSNDAVGASAISAVESEPALAQTASEPPATAVSVPSVQSAVELPAPVKSAASNEHSVHGQGARELKLSASATTWVQAREGERTVFVGVINPGQTRVLRLKEGARLVVGNAGGLSVVWQGEDVGAVGPLGQVRIVTVSPEGVSVVAPVKTSSPASSPDTARHVVSAGYSA